MDRPVAYIVHDAVHNNEGYITDYSPENIAAAKDAKFIFLAEYADGTREIVQADDVAEPENSEGGTFVFVQPSYVDERMGAVINVFDALAADAQRPAVMTLSEGVDTAEAQTFAEALAELKRIVFSDGGGER